MIYPKDFINKIIQGDCLDVIKEIPDQSVDMILQDPPYNLTNCDWEWNIMDKIKELWEQWLRIVKPKGAIVMTAVNPFASMLVMSNLKMYRHEWIWVKNYSTNTYNCNKLPLRIFENVLVFGKQSINYYPIMKPGLHINHNGIAKNGIYGNMKSRNPNTRDSYYPNNILRFNGILSEAKKHPSQKPVELFEYLIRTYTLQGEIVFDGFAGSGTTAVAAKEMHRKFICIEKEPKYVEIARDRLKQEIMMI